MGATGLETCSSDADQHGYPPKTMLVEGLSRMNGMAALYDTKFPTALFSLLEVKDFALIP